MNYELAKLQNPKEDYAVGLTMILHSDSSEMASLVITYKHHAADLAK